LTLYTSKQRKFVPLFDYGGTFSICICVKEISPKNSLLGRVLIMNALLILMELLGKKVKMTRDKLYFKVRKYTKWKAIML